MITFLVDGVPYMVISSDNTSDSGGHFDVLDFDQSVLVYQYFNILGRRNVEDNDGWEWKQDIMALGVTDLDFFAINGIFVLRCLLVCVVILKSRLWWASTLIIKSRYRIKQGGEGRRLGVTDFLRYQWWYVLVLRVFVCLFVCLSVCLFICLSVHGYFEI